MLKGNMITRNGDLLETTEDIAASNSHTHSNKTVLDGITSTDITNWNNKTSNVDTGIIAFDQNNPGWTLHLVAEFTPNDSTETNAIIIANNGGSSQGLTVYSSGSYCYCKIKTQAYGTNGSKFGNDILFVPKSSR